MRAGERPEEVAEPKQALPHASSRASTRSRSVAAVNVGRKRSRDVVEGLVVVAGLVVEIGAVKKPWNGRASSRSEP